VDCSGRCMWRKGPVSEACRLELPPVGQRPLVIRPLLSLKKRPHFKTKLYEGGKTCLWVPMGPETKVYCAGEFQQWVSSHSVRCKKRSPSSKRRPHFEAPACLEENKNLGHIFRRGLKLKMTVLTGAAAIWPIDRLQWCSIHIVTCPEILGLKNAHR
jgi:hypothetical protein